MTTDRLNAYGVLLLRLALGTVFLAHSIVYMLLTLTLAGTVEFFVSIGLPAWLAYAAFVAEAVGGILLILASRHGGWLSCCRRSCSGRPGPMPAMDGCLRRPMAGGNTRFIYSCFALHRQCWAMAPTLFGHRDEGRSFLGFRMRSVHGSVTASGNLVCAVIARRQVLRPHEHQALGQRPYHQRAAARGESATYHLATA